MLSQELGLPVYVGMRNWKPYIADVLAKMRAGRHRSVPWRFASHRRIHGRAWASTAKQSSRRRAGCEIEFVEGWADHPLLADAFAERLRAVWEPFSAETGRPVPVLFTAHSVPCRTMQAQSAEATCRSLRG